MRKKHSGPERRQFNVNMTSDRDELMVADFRTFVKTETRLTFPQAVLEAMEAYMRRQRAVHSIPVGTEPAKDADPAQGF